MERSVSLREASADALSIAKRVTGGEQISADEQAAIAWELLRLSEEVRIAVDLMKPYSGRSGKATIRT